MPSTLTLDKILIVEGADEERFFRQLLKHLAITDVQIVKIEGKDNLFVKLRTLMADDGFDRVTSMGVVRDADHSAASSFQSVADIFARLGLAIPKKPGDFANKARKKVGVFIMPGGSASGMLEDLCLATVGDHPVSRHVQDFFSALTGTLSRRDPVDAPMQEGTYYFPKNEAKARVQAFLAGMHETVCGVGRGAECGFWNLDHASLVELKEFLRRLRLPV